MRGSILVVRCDTCHKEVKEVSRVVVDEGYDRSLAPALYNCPDCFAQKDRQRRARVKRPGARDER